MTELWIYGLPKERLPALGLLKELGYKTVTVGREREAVDAISRAGMRAHVCVGSFSLNENTLQRKGSLARRLDGGPAEWFGSGCPNNPKVRAASLDSVREAASIEGAEARGSAEANPDPVPRRSGAEEERDGRPEGRSSESIVLPLLRWRRGRTEDRRRGRQRAMGRCRYTLPVMCRASAHLPR